MSPIKTIETIAETLTSELQSGTDIDTEAVLDICNKIARAVSGFGLLRLIDSSGALVGFTVDKRPNFLPAPSSVDSPDPVV